MRLLPWEYGTRNLLRSPLRLALGVGGNALVVLLVLAAASFVRGMGQSLERSGGERNLMLLGAGSEESVERSEIGRGIAGIAAASIPGVKKELGVSYVSPEVHMATLVQLSREDETQVFASMRGVEAGAFLVHEKVHITAGRAPGPGELLVGTLAAARMGLEDSDLALGKSLWFDDREWQITGHFEAPGTVMEAEIWVPLQDLLVAVQRETLSCVVITLGPDGDFTDADLFTKQRLDLELVAFEEGDYYSKVLAFYEPVRAMVWVTALLVAAGAFFGGLNTMYASFAARIRELATLQSLGFRRPAIVLSLIQESMLTACAGALLAAGFGILLLDGVAVRISMGAFGLTVDGVAMGAGMLAGVLLGVIGALPPAWRCLGIPISQALKSA